MARVVFGRRLAAAQDSVTAEQGGTWVVRDLARLVPLEHDELALTWVGDSVATIVFKLATVVVGTLTVTRDGQGHVTGVKRT